MVGLKAVGVSSLHSCFISILAGKSLTCFGVFGCEGDRADGTGDLLFCDVLSSRLVLLVDKGLLANLSLMVELLEVGDVLLLVVVIRDLLFATTMAN